MSFGYGESWPCYDAILCPCSLYLQNLLATLHFKEPESISMIN